MIQKLSFQNKLFQKSTIKNLLLTSLINYGKTRTTNLVTDLQNLGFYYATKSGISIGIEELRVPNKKLSIISNSNLYLKLINLLYKSSKVNLIEKSNIILSHWNRTTTLLSQSLSNFLQNLDPFNSLHLMVFSGARGNLAQVKQLMGMRGLISDSQGQLIEIPILHNFKEGLNLTEYLIATFGARKGIVDTALNTASAGYLTRRLVNSVNDYLIRDFDCSTLYFIKIYCHYSKSSFMNYIIGRTCVDTIYNIKTQAVLIYKNTCITPVIAANLYNYSGITYIRVYSVLTCMLDTSICKKCYGWDISAFKLIGLGIPIGVIASHAIGEPATQLTMRTFHTGGSFTLSVNRQILAKMNGLILGLNSIVFKRFRNKYGKSMALVLKPINFYFLNYYNFKERISLNYGSLLHVINKQYIKKKTLIAELLFADTLTSFSSFQSIIAPHSGELQFLTKLNLLIILKGTVFDFPINTFLNNFKNLKFFCKPYLVFLFKLYSLTSGFLPSLKSGELNLHLISQIQLFLFPLFWDRKLQKLIFLQRYKKYFILKNSPFFNNKFFSCFAQQRTFLYDTFYNGFITCLLDFSKGKIKYSNHLSFQTNPVFLYHYAVVSSSLLNSFRIFTVVHHQIYFIGEFRNFTLARSNKNISSFLTLVNILPIYCYSIKFPNFFISKSSSVCINSYILKNLNLFYFTFYTGKTLDFIQTFLFLKIYNFRPYSLKLYGTTCKYLILCFKFYLTFTTKFLTALTRFVSIPFYINFQEDNLELVLRSTLLAFFSVSIKNFGVYKKFKKYFTFTSRFFLINFKNFFSYFFETIRIIKNVTSFFLFNTKIFKFLKIFKSGKLFRFTPFKHSLYCITSFFVSSNTQLFYLILNFVKKGEILGFICFEQIFTGDIVQGLPKLEEFLELQNNSKSSIFVPFSGLIVNLTFGFDDIKLNFCGFKSILSSVVIKSGLFSNMYLNKYEFFSLGQKITAGSINFFKLLHLFFLYFLEWETLFTATFFSFKKLQILFLKKLNLIFTKQHILISFKHLEIIIKQLTSYIQIIGDFTNIFLLYEIIKFSIICMINTIFRIENQKCVYYRPIIMGITKVSFQSPSFLANASFQSTTTVLARSALEGKIDWIFGIQETIILGQPLLIGKNFLNNNV